MTTRRPDREHRWRVNSLWIVPLACIMISAVAVAAVLVVDGLIGYDLLPSSVLGTPTAVQTVLSTAASAMLTLTTIVLTVMTLSVQLAMQQFSPRIVRALLADRRSQLAHGLFAGTFLFCMVAVAKVNDQGKSGSQVPSLTVAAAYLLLLASLIALVAYVHLAGQSLRVAGLVDLVGDNLRTEIDRLFPTDSDDGAATAGDTHTIIARDAGVIVVIDVGRMVELARRADDCIEMAAAMGDFVPAGAPLARTRGRLNADDSAWRRVLLLDNERSHVGDAPYGLRKLVEIAERSVASSPFADPMTAVQSIDRIHDAMRLLCTRRLPDGRYRDAGGVLRLVTRELSWSGYVAVAFDELIHLGASSPLLARRLLNALDDLVAIAPPERRPPLEARRDRLVAEADGSVLPLFADVQGLGGGRDVIVER